MWQLRVSIRRSKKTHSRHSASHSVTAHDKAVTICKLANKYARYRFCFRDGGVVSCIRYCLEPDMTVWQYLQVLNVVQAPQGRSCTARQNTHATHTFHGKSASVLACCHILVPPQLVQSPGGTQQPTYIHTSLLPNPHVHLHTNQCI
jgi:hypothetical protein